LQKFLNRQHDFRLDLLINRLSVVGFPRPQKRYSFYCLVVTNNALLYRAFSNAKQFFVEGRHVYRAQLVASRFTADQPATNRESLHESMTQR